MGRTPSRTLVVATFCGAFVGGAWGAGLSRAESDPYAELSVFARVLGYVERNYVEAIPFERLVRAAIRGVVEELDGPSDYLDPAAFEALKAEARPKFGGVGVVLTERDGRKVVVEVHPDTPAERARIEPGDVVVAVDGAPAASLPLPRVAERIRGAPGTTVQLSIERSRARSARGGAEAREEPALNGAAGASAVKPMPRVGQRASPSESAGAERAEDLPSGAPRRGDADLRGAEHSASAEEAARVLRLVRARIYRSTASGRRIGSVGYLRLVRFDARTAQDVVRGLDAVREGEALSGLVLDLRGNPGGLLDQAVAVSDLWLSSGPIVTTVGRDRPPETSRARRGGTEPRYPVAVLVDDGTASAAEIVAGALQDRKRGRVFGRRTFGKGSVQTLIELEDRSALKLTIARYLTPSGRMIDGAGIEPDVVVQMDARRLGHPGADPCLDAALTWLRSRN